MYTLHYWIASRLKRLGAGGGLQSRLGLRMPRILIGWIVECGKWKAESGKSPEWCTRAWGEAEMTGRMSTNGESSVPRQNGRVVNWGPLRSLGTNATSTTILPGLLFVPLLTTVPFPNQYPWTCIGASVTYHRRREIQNN
ncbi:hypothetical protein ACMFMG_001168 [Clarireedia jacksonii]